MYIRHTSNRSCVGCGPAQALFKSAVRHFRAAIRIMLGIICILGLSPGEPSIALVHVP